MSEQGFSPRTVSLLRRNLLAWYDAGARRLPWRETRDPYSIWVSEIMLQQTRVAAVLGHYRNFLERFPTVAALARAPEQDVLAAWSGLGYYRRARMLHQAARLVAGEYGAELPRMLDGLRQLPGIGSYTAAAIASIAFGEPHAAVDGNVERVITRLAGLTLGSEGAIPRARFERLAGRLLDRHRPGDFNQAMMELGATVCTPRAPACASCPLFAQCLTHGEHPRARRQAMLSRTVAYALAERAGRRGRELLLEQRSEDESVMAGLWELPALGEAEFPAEELRMTVRHAIMRVNYYVRIRMLDEGAARHLLERRARLRWVRPYEAAGLALTGLARKVLRRSGFLSVDPAGLVRGAAAE